MELAVCTIEKANIIVNQLIDSNTNSSSSGMDQLTMIVVDELHLVSDSKRGFLLEVLLSKARFAWGSGLQIIGMSATLPNLGDVARWIDGAMYCTQYRPVELETRICVDRCMYTPTPTTAQASAQLQGVTEAGGRQGVVNPNVGTWAWSSGKYRPLFIF